MRRFNLWLRVAIYALVIVVILGGAYLGVFGRALRQDGNHFRIALALPQVLLTGEVVPIDGNLYLAKNTADFIEAMKREGYEHVEQMGAGHIFKKGYVQYTSISRMYSRYFMLFTRPAQSSWECNGDGFRCPDGTMLGRTGPKCEFPACP